MAFTSSLIKREPLNNGKIQELWLWTATAVTTGTVTPDSTDAQGIGEIKSIDGVTSTVTSTDAALVLTYSDNISRGTVTVTCTAASTGVLTLWGNAQ